MEKHLKPIKDLEKFSEKYKKIGTSSLEKNELAVVFLAGGEGSRLGLNKPKGCLILDDENKRSLFELFCIKIKNKEKEHNLTLQIAFMLSKKNEKATKEFFQKANFFGLQKEQIHFFVQEDLPYLDLEQKKLKNKDGFYLEGAAGNGSLFESLKKSFLLEKFKDKGIKYLQVIPIDNPLAEPFDEIFLGFHISKQNQVSLIALEKSHDLNNMGVLAEDEQKRLLVLEYLYLQDSEYKNLTFNYLNSALFLFSLNFLEKSFNLPEHLALKEIDLDCRKVKVYKREKFIFDLLPFTEKAGAIVYPKESCFAPIKTKEDIPMVYQLLKKTLK